MLLLGGCTKDFSRRWRSFRYDLGVILRSREASGTYSSREDEDVDAGFPKQQQWESQQQGQQTCPSTTWSRRVDAPNGPVHCDRGVRKSHHPALQVPLRFKKIWQWQGNESQRWECLACQERLKDFHSEYRCPSTEGLINLQECAFVGRSLNRAHWRGQERTLWVLTQCTTQCTNIGWFLYAIIWIGRL